MGVGEGRRRMQAHISPRLIVRRRVVQRSLPASSANKVFLLQRPLPPRNSRRASPHISCSLPSFRSPSILPSLVRCHATSALCSSSIAHRPEHEALCVVLRMAKPAMTTGCRICSKRFSRCGSQDAALTKTSSNSVLCLSDQACQPFELMKPASLLLWLPLCCMRRTWSACSACPRHSPPPMSTPLGRC